MQKCLANDDSCKTCFETDGCNRQQRFSECFVTDQPLTSAEPPYEFDTKSSPKICVKYNDTCFTQVLKNDTVIRGCVNEYAAENDLPSSLLSENEGNNRTYQTCSSPLCNEKPLAASFCFACNSIDDSKCRENPIETVKCPMEINPSGCYHFDNGSYVERGCIAKLNADQRVNCESDSENCKKCAGNECNDKSKFLACYSYDTSKNVTEGRSYSELFANANRTVCKRYDNECYIHVFNETVRRGCLNDAEDESVTIPNIPSDCKDNPKVCELCSGYLCNDRILSAEYCYSCRSPTMKNDDCQLGPKPNMKIKCPLTLKKFGCYLWTDKFEYGNRNAHVSRGCVSDLDPKSRSVCETPSTDATCKICDGDGCNGKVFFQTCVDSSSETDENCVECYSKHSKINTRQCEDYMAQCYTHVENGIVTRNCTDSLVNTSEKCTSDPKHCLPCSGALCNGQAVERDICVSCDSEVDPNCRSISNTTDESIFTEYPISIINTGCFHFVDRSTDRHIRGKSFFKKIF